MTDPFNLLSSNIYTDGLWWDQLPQEEKERRNTFYDLMMSDIAEEVNEDYDRQHGITSGFTPVNASKPETDAESTSDIKKRTIGRR